MSDLTVIAPPAEEPLTLAAAKDFLRLGTTAEDGLVTELIRAGRAHVETASGLAFVTRTLKRRWTAWPYGLMLGGVKLRPAPARALVSVVRVDAEGGRAFYAVDQINAVTFQGGLLRIQMIPCGCVNVAPSSIGLILLTLTLDC